MQITITCSYQKIKSSPKHYETSFFSLVSLIHTCDGICNWLWSSTGTLAKPWQWHKLLDAKDQLAVYIIQLLSSPDNKNKINISPPYVFILWGQGEVEETRNKEVTATFWGGKKKKKSLSPTTNPTLQLFIIWCSRLYSTITCYSSWPL